VNPAQLADPYAAERALLIGIGPFILGLVLVGVLIAAVWYGIRLRRRELPPPHPEEQPTVPPAGPVGDHQEEHPGDGPAR
jgi:hypothetical protein